ncbi:MAG UNVERIFIED_CONTAM: TIGR03032 family protein [Microcystis novacekii LVE1205-3]
MGRSRLCRVVPSAGNGGLWWFTPDERRNQLRCGLAIVNLATSQLVATFWFNSGVEEVFAVSVLPRPLTQR